MDEDAFHTLAQQLPSTRKVTDEDAVPVAKHNHAVARVRMHVDQLRARLTDATTAKEQAARDDAALVAEAQAAQARAEMQRGEQDRELMQQAQAHSDQQQQWHQMNRGHQQEINQLKQQLERVTAESTAFQHDGDQLRQRLMEASVAQRERDTAFRHLEKSCNEHLRLAGLIQQQMNQRQEQMQELREMTKETNRRHQALTRQIEQLVSQRQEKERAAAAAQRRSDVLNAAVAQAHAEHAETRAALLQEKSQRRASNAAAEASKQRVQELTQQLENERQQHRETQGALYKAQAALQQHIGCSTLSMS